MNRTNRTIEPQARRQPGVTQDRIAAAGDVRRTGSPAQTDTERLGLVLLGIGFDSSVA